MTRALHADGYDVAIHYHTSADAARALAAELNAARADSARVVHQDLAAARAGERLVAALGAAVRRLDVLVNNASIFDPDALDDDPTGAGEPAHETWERLHAINVRTPYFLALAAAPLLRAARGCIVNIADIHGERPRRGYAMYGASKAGLLALTRALALELAPEIRVNGVSPGAILWADSESAQTRAEALRAVPLGRRGDPADIAEAVTYLARAAYVTGHVINVDGGRMLRC